MRDRNIAVKELQETDIPAIVRYWTESEPAFLLSMGVDLEKVPDKDDLTAMLTTQLNKPVEQKRSYCLIWKLGELSIGHCNTNPTQFGNEAYMHLHLWSADTRFKGLGTEFVKKSLPWFFEKLQLKRLISEPYALNPAPSKTLEKCGFEFVREYTTVPGSLNFEQPVKRWELSLDRFNQLKAGS